MTAKQATHRSMIKQSTRQNYYTDGVRNATALITGQIIIWVIMVVKDYFYLLKKEVTGLRTHVSNVSSIFKEFTAPLMDSLKTTKRKCYWKSKCCGLFKNSYF